MWRRLSYLTQAGEALCAQLQVICPTTTVVHASVLELFLGAVPSCISVYRYGLLEVLQMPHG